MCVPRSHDKRPRPGEPPLAAAMQGRPAGRQAHRCRLAVTADRPAWHQRAPASGSITCQAMQMAFSKPCSRMYSNAAGTLCTPASQPHIITCDCIILCWLPAPKSVLPPAAALRYACHADAAAPHKTLCPSQCTQIQLTGRPPGTRARAWQAAADDDDDDADDYTCALRSPPPPPHAHAPRSVKACNKRGRFLQRHAELTAQAPAAPAAKHRCQGQRVAERAVACLQMQTWACDGKASCMAVGRLGTLLQTLGTPPPATPRSAAQCAAAASGRLRCRP